MSIAKILSQLLSGGATGALKLPAGSTAERPSGQSGLVRMNSTTGAPEWYDLASSGWKPLSFDEVLAPTNSLPANGATGVPGQPVLTSGSFVTAYSGVTHAASQWQVSTSPSFGTTVVNTGDDVSNLTTYTVPYNSLSINTTYYWRVRHKNARGVYSNWSAATSFVTASVFRTLAALTISADTTNYVLNTAKVSGYSAGMTDVVVTINSGVTVGSTSTSTYAFDVDTSWNSADTVKIVNNGTICGTGGSGGYGGGAPGAGYAGGPGLRVQRAVSVTNNNVIAGGGGGGGAAGACGPGCSYGGGGGGAGSTPGGPGSSGGGGGCNITCDAGTATTGGLGYAGNGSYGRVANGYNGGTRGAAGVSGCTTAGGAGGAATNGTANITWVATGTRLGTIG